MAKRSELTPYEQLLRKQRMQAKREEARAQVALAADQNLGTVFVQDMIGGGHEILFRLAPKQELVWDVCVKCHVEVLPYKGRQWDKLGAENHKRDWKLREHVHTGALGKKASRKKIKEQHSTLFDNKEIDQA
jgi:hypothetical protein